MVQDLADAEVARRIIDEPKALLAAIAKRSKTLRRTKCSRGILAMGEKGESEQ